MGRRVRLTRYVPYVVGGAVVVVDQLSKALATRYLLSLSPDGIHLAGGFVYLRYLENTGVAFGLLQGQGPLLTGLALLVVGILIVYYRYLPRHTWLLQLSLGAILGGAAGNLLDRVRLGYVVDFVDLTYWPIFNLADACICIGVGILASHLLLEERQTSRESRVASRES
jgi:signal peptidase II